LDPLQQTHLHLFELQGICVPSDAPNKLLSDRKGQELTTNNLARSLQSEVSCYRKDVSVSGFFRSCACVAARCVLSADWNSIPNARTLLQANLLFHRLDSWMVYVYPRVVIGFVVDLLVLEPRLQISSTNSRQPSLNPDFRLCSLGRNFSIFLTY
jgi:hypothetical protein